jgi:hypothetical protein
VYRVHTGRPPSDFEHIMGPGADKWGQDAAADFWLFAHTWGVDCAAAQDLILNGGAAHVDSP